MKSADNYFDKHRPTLTNTARDALRLIQITPTLAELSVLLDDYCEAGLDEVEEALVR